MSEAGGENNRDVWNNDGLQTNSFHNNSTQLPHQNANLFVNPEHQYINQNLQIPQTTTSGSTGNYTMLSVGHGNYLKVYHNTDEREDFNKYELFSSKTVIPSHTINQNPIQYDTQNDGVSSSTSLFLNQLVGNLGSQNISGTYSPFGESMTIPNNIQYTNNNNHTNDDHQPHNVIILNQQNQNILQENHNITATPPITPHKYSKYDKNLSRSTTQFENIRNIENNNVHKIKLKTQEATIKKPRIVAEVKPMRMSYSDVLSQNVSINSNENGTINSGNTPTKSTTNNITAINNNKPSNNNKTNSFVYDKKLDETNIRGNQAIKSSSSGVAIKKSVNDININQILSSSSSSTSSTDKENMKKSSITSYDELKNENILINENDLNKNKKKLLKNSNSIKINKFNKTNNNSDNQNIKRSSFNNNNINNDEDIDDDDEDDIEEDDERNEYYMNNSFYNVAKTNVNNENNHNIEKIQQTNKFGTRSRTKNNLINPGRFVSNKADKFGCNNTSNKRGQKIRRNRKYVFVAKLLEKWMEYMMKLLTWLLSLVSDVILLSFGIVWDHVNHVGQYVMNSLRSLRNELRHSHTYFSLNWFKLLCKRFDMRFAKNSKWAFWRKIYIKKKVVEPVSDFYKNGRLPQTGDEAMYSLLNCKGKDAYSILGVSPDCTQEQIRKHYKKIAVLVHPDKNKQPGAEEAFKILQRAFELIGEPENRNSYDQSVAEALNAEKAWSELNDLLTQLHTKIAEAANTIRCSSCGLRHPRKPTGRPHYAARECNSCKIRHSAREGDIWAETTFFGLRWKYLALMEGTVYDITEWANCQKGALSHLQPNSHIVQYRIVLGGQQQQQSDKEKLKKNISSTEPNLDDFLNNLYGVPNQQPPVNSTRRRTKKN